VIDTPTNNFCTWNPNTGSKFDNLGNLTADLVVFSNGNLNITSPASPGDGDSMVAISIMAIPDGVPIYAEFTNMNSNTAISVGGGFKYPNPGSGGGGETFYGRAYYLASGSVAVGFGSTGTVTGSPASFTTSDIIGVRVDKDNQTLKFYKNNVLQATVSSLVVPDYNWYFQTNIGTSGATSSCNANWGQLPFTYSLPTDHLALSTANLPEPTIGPNSDIITSEVFEPILYTGNGTSQSISTLEFQPDFTWIKNRDAADNHMLFDVVRGATKYLSSNLEVAEVTDAQSLSSFNSNGFSVGNNVAVNTNAEDYVAWNWKVGGSGVSNTDGSISATVSVNTDAGISLSKGNVGTSGNVTIGHGLGVAPDFVIGKSLIATAWPVLVPSVMTKDNYFFLSRTDAVATYTDYWGSALPTSSVIGLQAGIGFANDTLFYSFVSTEGFSSFGKYTGNGSATGGPFIYTGFRPAFVVIKRTNSAEGWYVQDSARNTYNAADRYLQMESAAAGYSADPKDLLSNGFKIKNNYGGQNASGGTYIYMAFAENPFKYANAR
jgi:hypothetical protein